MKPHKATYKAYISDVVTGGMPRTRKIGVHTFYALVTFFAVNALLFLAAVVSGANQDYLHHIQQLAYSFTWLNVFITVLLFPVVEEFAFRMLLSCKKDHVLISTSMIYAFFISLSVLFIFRNEIENDLLVFSIIWCGVLVKGLIMFSVPFLGHRSFAIVITNFVKENFKVVYYVSAGLFAFIPVFAQSLYGSISAPVLVCVFISYFVSGLIFNSGRMALGMYYVIALHAGINLLGMI